jgi:hypothetical protein
MRKRLAQVLERDDEDEPMDAVVRRFWSRTKSPLPTKTTAPARVVSGEHANVVAREHANVVDLARARWARAHGVALL